MKDQKYQMKTRKRCRTSTRIRERYTRSSSSSSSSPSWSYLLIMLAAAASIASSSSTASWAVRGQPDAENDTNSANVRGGRGSGEGRGGRAFVRQHPSRETTNNIINDNNNNINEHNNFLTWCQDSLGIDTSLVEIDQFDYPDYIKAMEDRIDIFCEDCNDDDDDEEDYDYGNDNNVNNDLEGNAQGETMGSATTSRIKYLDETDRSLSVLEEYPPVSVRGLKAARDISEGEVVLSIPHSALWTVHNAIDASGDVNLMESMGPRARRVNNWESPGMDEIPLLAVTLLYHMDKNTAYDNNNNNNMHAPYLEILQTNNLENSIPHLWNSRKLRKSATPSVLRVAQGIRKDVVDLYESIVKVVIQSHPDVFGKNIDDDENDDKEWMFSLEKFHWAFALVNSRHWHLEIPDDPFFVVEEEALATEPAIDPQVEEQPKPSQEPTESSNIPMDDHESYTDQEGPPAATPTDEWVVIQDEKLREEEEREMMSAEGSEPTIDSSETTNDSNESSDEYYDYWPSGNSFLAPLADLLNFGPPCTRGTYNPETMAFEIVATCEFKVGQEITFWYTNACEDIFVANYGFTMPMMVPKCNDKSTNKHTTTMATTSTSTTSNSNNEVLWQQQQQEYLEDELFHAYEELDRLDRRLDFLMNVLEDCHCGNQTELLKGAWDYSNENSENNEQLNDVETTNGIDSSTSSKQPLPLPKTPSRPTNKPTTTKQSKKSPEDAQHAIRDGRSRKTKKNDEQQPHRHRHHASMTRFRSRRNHQGRRVEPEF